MSLISGLFWERRNAAEMCGGVVLLPTAQIFLRFPNSLVPIPQPGIRRHHSLQVIQALCVSEKLNP